LEQYLTVRGVDKTITITFFHRQFGVAVIKKFLSGENAVIRHSILATYFDKNSLYYEKNGAKTPNYRKLSELVYNLLKAEKWERVGKLLTNPTFIEAKCIALMVYDLLRDYKEALKFLSGTTLENWVNFLTKRASFLTEYPQCLLGEIISEFPSSDLHHPQIASVNGLLQNSGRSWLKKASGDASYSSWLSKPTIAVGFSSNGSTVLTGDGEGKVHVWDSKDWHLRAIHSFSNKGNIMRLHVFDDNKHYILVPSYGEIIIVSLETGIIVKKFGNLWDADISYITNHILLIINRDGGELWSIKDKNPRPLQSDEPADYLPFWAGLDGVGISRVQGIFDLSSCQRTGTLGLQGVPAGYIWREHIFRYYTPYALVAHDTAIHVGEFLTVHSLPSGEIVEKYDLSEITSKKYAEGSIHGRVTIGHAKRILLIWDNMGKVLIFIDLLKHKRKSIRFDMYILLVELDPSENVIYVCLADNTLVFNAKKHALRLFSTKTLEELRGPSCLPSSLSRLSGDGAFALLGDCRIMNVETGLITAEIEEPKAIWTKTCGTFPFIGFLKDKNCIVGYKSDGSIHKIVECVQEPSIVRVSADKKIIAIVFGSYYTGTRVKIAQTQTSGSWIINEYVIDNTFGDALSVDMSPTGKWLLVAINHIGHIGISSGYAIYLLNTTEGKIQSKEKILNFINMIILIPNTQFLAVGFNDGTVQIRSMYNLNIHWNKKIHHGSIRIYTASPDGKLLATIGSDQTLIITSVSTGKIITAKPFSFLPSDCVFASQRDLVLVSLGDKLFKYHIHIGAIDKIPS